MPRLRRSDPHRPGYTRRRRRPGLDLPRHRRAADRRPGDGRPDPGPGDPAGLAGRVDLPVPERAHPGRRHRRGRPPAVPLPRRLAGAAGRGASSTCGCCEVGERLPAMRRRWARDLRRDGLDRRAGAGRGGPAARPRPVPGRRRGVRRGARHVRAGHPAAGARDGPAGPAGLRLPGQGRPAPAGGRQRAAGGRGGDRAAPAPGRRQPGAVRLLGRRLLERREERRRSTSTCARCPGGTCRPRTSAPGTPPC